MTSSDRTWSRGTRVKVRGYEAVYEVVRPHPRKLGFVEIRDASGQLYDVLASGLREARADER